MGECGRKTRQKTKPNFVKRGRRKKKREKNVTKRTKEERETNMANSLRGFDLKIEKKRLETSTKKK